MCLLFWGKMIYLDSAIVSEVETALKLGWVKGITTNPILLAKNKISAEKTLKQLAQMSPGELYYQLTASDFEEMIAEAHKAFNIIGQKTVLKVPASTIGFKVVASLSREIPCAVTGIYSASQAVISREAGAKYAIVYVNRATRLLGDGLALIRDMSVILQNSHTKILAASLKSPEEAAGAIIAGANHLTMPLNILKAMTTHELSEETIEDFATKGIGITV